jgi:GNAT superfamily N-acetyltransferase
MSQQLRLQDPEALLRLQNAMGRFAEETQASLSALEHATARTLASVQERLRYWDSQVRQAQQALQIAQAALRQCEQSGGVRDSQGRTYAPDCSAQQRAVRLALAKLQECQAKQQKTRQCLALLEDAVRQYQRSARRLRALAGNHTERARLFLQRKAEEYRQVHAAADHNLMTGNMPGSRGAVNIADGSSSGLGYGDKPIVDEFQDKTGRTMTITCSSIIDHSNGSYRLYELYHGRQRAGRVNMTLERSHEQQVLGTDDPNLFERVKIHDILVEERYQQSGSAKRLLAQVENEAQRHGANEIYGQITEREAISFWNHMTRYGWQVEHQVEQLIVRKKL